MFYSSAPKEEIEDAESQLETSCLYRDVDDACAEVSKAYSKHARSECHQWLLKAQNLSPGEPAVVLNIYRLNFGGNPDGFAQWVAALPESHPWHAKYARANLAWNIVRIGLRLAQRGRLGGEMDNHLSAIVQAVLDMRRVARRDLIAGRPFPFNVPLPLISWYDEQSHFVGADCEESPLHASSFYEEANLFHLAEITRQQTHLSFWEDLQGDSTKLETKDQGRNEKPRTLNAGSKNTTDRQLHFGEALQHVHSKLNGVDDLKLDREPIWEADSDSELSEHSDTEFEELEPRSNTTPEPLVQQNDSPERSDTESGPQTRRSARVHGKLRPDYKE
jgi:hypothetical protein